MLVAIALLKYTAVDIQYKFFFIGRFKLFYKIFGNLASVLSAYTVYRFIDFSIQASLTSPELVFTELIIHILY
jgi:hypothetical protein